MGNSIDWRIKTDQSRAHEVTGVKGHEIIPGIYSRTKSISTIRKFSDSSVRTNQPQECDATGVRLHCSSVENDTASTENISTVRESSDSRVRTNQPHDCEATGVKLHGSTTDNTAANTGDIFTIRKSSDSRLGGEAGWEEGQLVNKPSSSPTEVASLQVGLSEDTPHKAGLPDDTGKYEANKSKSRRSSVRIQNGKHSIEFSSRIRQMFFSEETCEKIFVGKRVAKLVNTSPPMYVVENFLSERQCQYFDELQVAEAGKFEKSYTQSNTEHAVHSEERTSTFITLKKFGDSKVREIEMRAADLVGMPADNIEPLQVVQYKGGQYFGMHHDAGELCDDGKVVGVKPGHPVRLVTFFVYLNTLERRDGGATHFPELGLKFQPKRGTALIFCNIHEDGEPDCNVVHQATPTTLGRTKLGMNIWVSSASMIQYQNSEGGLLLSKFAPQAKQVISLTEKESNLARKTSTRKEVDDLTFSDVFSYLFEKNDWAVDKGFGLFNWIYLRPGFSRTMARNGKAKLGADFFISEESVMAYIRENPSIVARLLSSKSIKQEKQTRVSVSPTGGKPKRLAASRKKMTPVINQKTKTISTKKKNMKRPIWVVDNHTRGVNKKAKVSKAEEETILALSHLVGDSRDSVEDSKTRGGKDMNDLTFKDIFPLLFNKAKGWTVQRGTGLFSWVYMRPGFDRKMLKKMKRGEDYFNSEEAVMTYIRANPHILGTSGEIDALVARKAGKQSPKSKNTPRKLTVTKNERKIGRPVAQKAGKQSTRSKNVPRNSTVTKNEKRIGTPVTQKAGKQSTTSKSTPRKSPATKSETKIDPAATCKAGKRPPKNKSTPRATKLPESSATKNEKPKKRIDAPDARKTEKRSPGVTKKQKPTSTKKERMNQVQPNKSRQGVKASKNLVDTVQAHGCSDSLETPTRTKEGQVVPTVQPKVSKPTKTGAKGIDQLTFTDIYSHLFNDNGWKVAKGTGIHSWVYMRPGFDRKMLKKSAKPNQDFFYSEDDIMNYIKSNPDVVRGVGEETANQPVTHNSAKSTNEEKKSKAVAPPEETQRPSGAALKRKRPVETDELPCKHNSAKSTHEKNKRKIVAAPEEEVLKIKSKRSVGTDERCEEGAQKIRIASIPIEGNVFWALRKEVEF